MTQHYRRHRAAGVACALASLLTMYPVKSMEGQTVSVGSASGQPGWIVPVNVSFAPGPTPIAALSLDVSFDVDAMIMAVPMENQLAA